MPITFEVDKPHGYFVSSWRGRLTASELRRTYLDFFDSGRWTSSLNELVDLRHIDASALTTDEIMLFSKWSKTVYADRGITTTYTAIYAPDDLPFGLSRVYEGWAEGSPENIEIFRSLEAARNWVTSAARDTAVKQSGSAP